jgi:small subunit ribosomal protein S6e
MKINIAYPTNATQKSIEIKTKEEQRLYGRKINDQFDGAVISPEFAGSIVQIVGGNDYQGVPMTAAQATTKRIRLLLSKGDVGYRCRRNGVRRRKTVRGSVVSNEILALNVILVKPAEGKTIEGLTDIVKEKTHLPRRDKKLRAMFGIPEGEDTLSYIHKMIKDNDENATLPKIKITGVVSEEKKQKIAKRKVEREIKKKALLAEKAEYETKYGIKL